MSHKLLLRFDYPVENTNIVIPLQAVAELSSDDECYDIHSFEIRARDNNERERKPAFIAAIRIKPREEEGNTLWVHCDSQRESYLSHYAGMAIDKELQNKRN